MSKRRNRRRSGTQRRRRGKPRENQELIVKTALEIMSAPRLDDLVPSWQDIAQRLEPNEPGYESLPWEDQKKAIKTRREWVASQWRKRGETVRGDRETLGDDRWVSDIDHVGREAYIRDLVDRIVEDRLARISDDRLGFDRPLGIIRSELNKGASHLDAVGAARGCFERWIEEAGRSASMGSHSNGDAVRIRLLLQACHLDEKVRTLIETADLDREREHCKALEAALLRNGFRFRPDLSLTVMKVRVLFDGYLSRHLAYPDSPEVMQMFGDDMTQILLNDLVSLDGNEAS